MLGNVLAWLRNSLISNINPPKYEISSLFSLNGCSILFSVFSYLMVYWGVELDGAEPLFVLKNNLFHVLELKSLVLQLNDL